MTKDEDSEVKLFMAEREAEIDKKYGGRLMTKAEAYLESQITMGRIYERTNENTCDNRDVRLIAVDGISHGNLHILDGPGVLDDVQED